MRAEKMYLMNLVASLEDLDPMMEEILEAGTVELVPVLARIEENRFKLGVKLSNIQKALDFNEVHPFEKEDTKALEKLLTELESLFHPSYGDGKIHKPYDLEAVRAFHRRIATHYDHLSDLTRALRANESLREELVYLKDFPEDLKELQEMAFFNFRFGFLEKDESRKIKENYANIPAMIFHLGPTDRGELYLSIHPKDLENEVSRILRSLNWKDLPLPEGLMGTPRKILEDLREEDEKLRTKMKELQSLVEGIGHREEGEIRDLLLSLKLRIKLSSIKEYLAKSEHFFYLSGWISASAVPAMKSMLAKYRGTNLDFIEAKDTGDTPPTKLRNNWLFRPFELLVKMYGTPNYYELDPTAFFAITYLLLFGAMFGDVGQGLVFVLTGLWIARKKNPAVGGLAIRIGLSSTLFGFLYGSVFGLEHILPALLIRPFENINTVLVVAIALGVVLLTLSYLFGIANRLLCRELKEGLFSAEGVAGLLLFLSLVALALSFVLHFSHWAPLFGLLALLALLSILFKLPLSRLIEHKRPLHKGEDIGNYYIEEGFSLVETLMSMFSGTVSFIRVGAFAINHVGLFMAFTSIGEMIGSPMASFLMVLIGNLVILVLEGLIVFIQSLRLEYYELFGKFYKGDGKAFHPSKLID